MSSVLARYEVSGEAVRQHFQRAVAEDRFALLRLVLEHGEDEVLLAHPVGAFDAVGGRCFEQLGDVEVLEF